MSCPPCVGCPLLFILPREWLRVFAIDSAKAIFRENVPTLDGRSHRGVNAFSVWTDRFGYSSWKILASSYPDALSFSFLWVFSFVSSLGHDQPLKGWICHQNVLGRL
jgi:hypothetical protein